MRLWILLASLASLPAVPAAAARREPVLVRPTVVQVHIGTKSVSGYDELHFLGWNNSCSVALQYLSFPPTGKGLQGEPDRWRVGTLSLPPDSNGERGEWLYQSGTRKPWSWDTLDKLRADLLQRGFDVPGRIEEVRQGAVSAQPGLETVLKTTTTFRLGYAPRWPGPAFELSRIYYSPLGTCVLTVFRNRGRPRDSHYLRLLRIENPDVRRERARAHAANGLLLYQDASDLEGAEHELAIAVGLDPDSAVAHYHHARFLVLQGRIEESLAALKASVKREADFARQASAAPEFSSLRRDQRFQRIVEGVQRGER